MQWDIYWTEPALRMIGVPGTTEQEAIAEAIRAIRSKNPHDEIAKNSNPEMFMFGVPALSDADVLKESKDEVRTLDDTSVKVVVKSLRNHGVYTKCKALCRAHLHQWYGTVVLDRYLPDWSTGGNYYTPVLAFDDSDETAELFLVGNFNVGPSKIFRRGAIRMSFAKRKVYYDKRRRTTVEWLLDNQAGS